MRPPARIAVTGSSGYLGRRLVDELLSRPHVERVVGLDVKEAETIEDDRFHFVRHDICQPCATVLSNHGVEALAHLAFCFAPIRNRLLAARINLGGSRQVLDSGLRAHVRTLLYCSSGTAYGALPGNIRPLREDDPLRASPAFGYAYDKRVTDQMWQEAAGQHPDRRFIICRPCVVMGPAVDNYLSRMTTKRLVFLVRGYNPPMQFVHEQDVATGMTLMLERAPSGAYNLAAADTLTLPEIADVFGRRLMGLPAWLIYPLTQAAYSVGLRALSEVPRGFLDYVRYPWLLDPSRCQEQLGLCCRYSSRQAVEALYRAFISRYP